jgi:hypothetical protein
MRVAPAQMQRFTRKEGVGEDVEEDDDAQLHLMSTE